MIMSMGLAVAFPAVVLAPGVWDLMAETCQWLTLSSGSLDTSKDHSKAVRCPLLEHRGPPSSVVLPTPDPKAQLLCASGISGSWGNNPSPLTQARAHRAGGPLPISVTDPKSLSSSHCYSPTQDLCPRTKCIDL